MLRRLVRTDVAADQISVDVWVKNGGTSTATGTVDVALSSWTCDAVTYPELSVDAGFGARRRARR